MTATIRPFCDDELDEIDRSINDRYRLSDKVVVEHTTCGHAYRARRGGMKETEGLAMSNDDNRPMVRLVVHDDRSCSICFKLRARERAINERDIPDPCRDETLIDDRRNDDENSYSSPNYVERLRRLANKDAFYAWLYKRHF